MQSAISNQQSVINHRKSAISNQVRMGCRSSCEALSNQHQQSESGEEGLPLVLRGGGSWCHQSALQHSALNWEAGA
eukprot:6663820-Prymnesium_polylepis.3